MRSGVPGEVRPGRGLRVYPASGCVVPARWASTCGTLRLVERQQRPSSPRIVHSAQLCLSDTAPDSPEQGPSTDRTRRVGACRCWAGGWVWIRDGRQRPPGSRTLGMTLGLAVRCGLYSDCWWILFLSRDRSGFQMPHVFSLVSVRRNITPGTSTMLAASCEGLCNWACGVWPAWRGRRLLCLTT